MTTNDHNGNIPGMGSPEEREAILRFFDQGQDTWQIGRNLRRHESYIERQLHIALDTRRAMKASFAAEEHR